MGVKLTTTNKKEALSSYWRDSVTSYLGRELMNNITPENEGEGPILANLASDEYSAAIRPASLPKNTIFLNINFRHKGRVVAVHAKRARGLMARYLAENEATTLEDVSRFDWDNYRCMRETDGELYETVDTVGPNNVKIVRMVFDREDAPPKATDKKRPASKKKGTSKRAKK